MLLRFLCLLTAPLLIVQPHEQAIFSLIDALNFSLLVSLYSLTIGFLQVLHSAV